MDALLKLYGTQSHKNIGTNVGIHLKLRQKHIINKLIKTYKAFTFKNIVCLFTKGYKNILIFIPLSPTYEMDTSELFT